MSISEHAAAPRTTLRRHRLAATLAVGALAALAAVLLHPTSSQASPAKSGAVVKSATSGLGKVLVDRHGRTLYLFEKDSMGTSSCVGACASYWPPLLTTGKPLAGTGVRPGLLGATKRVDGTMQVTYNHHPLYTFALDKKAGQTNGQNVHSFGADWYVLSPAGVKIEKRAAAKSNPATSRSSSNSNSGGSNAYGY